MALVRQRSRSPLRLPLIPDGLCARPRARQSVHVISKLELALAAEIDRQTRQQIDRQFPHKEFVQNIYVNIYHLPFGQKKTIQSIFDKVYTLIDINAVNSEHTLSFSTRLDPNALGLVVHQIVTRYDVYELAASPVSDRQFAAVYRRKNVSHVDPFLRIRELSDLQKQAAEGEVLRDKVNRMKALYGTPKCFLGNTAFRQPDGSFKLVRSLKIGATVCLENGQHAQITHAMSLPATMQDLVELTTEQASLRVSANHPIETLNGPRVAKDLKHGDRIAVGQRIRKLTKVRLYEEGAELFDIRFNPDGPIQAYVIPGYGIQVRGAAPPDPLNLVQILQQVSVDDLMEALPEQYED